MKTIFSLCLCLVFISCSKDDDAPSIPDSEETSMAQAIANLVNDHRKSQGLSSLEVSDPAQSQAQIHSENMASGRTDFSHDGFDSRFDVLKSETNAKFMGENVARGQTSANQVMESWLNSPRHKANIEGNYTHIGVGISKSESGELFYTQIFISIP